MQSAIQHHHEDHHPPPTTEKAALDGVARTLMIPLWARAMESRKSRPIALDPRAREIVDALSSDSSPLDDGGFDFSIFKHAYGTQLGCVIRGLLYDRWVLDFLEAHPGGGGGTIVELGAGLTTRFERLSRRPSAANATWVDVDLPNVIALRERLLLSPSPLRLSAPRRPNTRTMIAASVTDRAWIPTLTRQTKPPYFFISEGMLMYLAPKDVRALLSRMATAFPGSTFALDSIAPVVVKHQRHHDSMKHLMDAPFGWGIEDIRSIEEWDPRLAVEESMTLVDIVKDKRFSHRIPRRHRAIAQLIRTALPWLERSYRIARVSF